MVRSMLIAAAVAVGFWSQGAAVAADAPAKEVALTGTLVCAKCKLKADGVKTCTNALLVKDGDKVTTYLLKDKGNGEDYHECGGGEKAGVAVSGTLTEKDGKMWIAPTKVVAPK